MIEKVFFGLASVLVFEGLMLALIPERIKGLYGIIRDMSPTQLSVFGLFMVSVGIVIFAVIEI